MCRYFNFGFFELPAYGCMVALGIIAFTLFVTFTLEKKEKLTKDQVDIVLLLSMIGFVILGGSAYLMNSLFHSIESKSIEMGGFTWLGGVLVAFPLTILIFNKFSKKTGINGIKLFEYVLPGLIVAHAFGRIGCFFAGCCFGGPTDSVFGVSYPKYSEAYFMFPNADETRSLPLWPTQLFEAFFEFALFGIMFGFRKKLKNYSIEIYCFSYGVFRFFLEYMRADDRGSTGFALSPSQIMSIILIAYGVVLLILKKTKHEIFEK